MTAGYHAAVTRIRTWVTSATTKGTNHYTITAFRNCDFFLASRLNIYAMRIIIPVWLWNTRHHALAEKHMMWVPLCNKCSKRKKTDTFLLCIDFARWLGGYYYFVNYPCAICGRKIDIEELWSFIPNFQWPFDVHDLKYMNTWAHQSQAFI